MTNITLDERLRPQLSRLDPKALESLCLSFLKARPELTASRHGLPVTKRVMDASAYGAKSGMKQKGIDLRMMMEGGEEWAFQCKRAESFGKNDVREAVKAGTYTAQHFFLVVTCDPGPGAQDEFARHPNWTLWGMEELCAELRTKLRPDQMVKVLSAVLSKEDLRRFLPLASEALVDAERFFENRLGAEHIFRHDWPLTGRETEQDELLKLLESGQSKAVIVEAKGGDGKSRLLLAVAREFVAHHPEGAALFYNPHRNEALDPLENCFQMFTGPTLVIVDDAHRTEEIPPLLLGLAEKQTNVKLLLAGRPDARESLRAALNAAGIDETRRTRVLLKPLPRGSIQKLATAALEDTGFSAEELTRLTHDSAFLTVVAGDLMRRRRLRPGEWASDEDFRARVFTCFEEENLRTIPSVEDQKLASSLLRVVAMLSPVAAGAMFVRQAAVVLIASEDDVHQLLGLMERASLLVVRKESYRVVPDLFADFLVWKVAYGDIAGGPTPMLHRVMGSFAQSTPALLRNIAEAAWLAGGDEAMAVPVVQPLLQQVRESFRASCFCGRAALLEMWQKFGLFLPTESLALAEEALAENEAPAHRSAEDDWLPHISEQLCGRGYMIEKLAPLLQEIALCHEEHQWGALDLLWKLAIIHEPGDLRFFNSTRPLKALAEVFTVSLRRPVGIVFSALRWLEGKVQLPAALKDIADHGGLLSAIMRPCFSLTASGTWRKGRGLEWRTAIQSPRTSRSLYDNAVTILRSVVEKGDLRTAVRAIVAAAPALSGLSKAELETLHSEKQDEAAAQLRECVREALQLLRYALERHPHWLMRITVHNELTQAACWSHDRVLVPEIREMLQQIETDLDFRIALAMTGGWNDETSNAWEDRSHDKWLARMKAAELEWEARTAVTVEELSRTLPDPGKLADHLQEIVTLLSDTTMHPQPRRLLRTMAKAVPRAALDLMHWLLAHPSHGLAWHWTFLMKDNPLLEDSQRKVLLCSVVVQLASDLRLAAVQEILRIPHGQAPDETTVAALKAAAPAFTPEEAAEVLQTIELSAPPGALWAREVFRLVPLETMPAAMAPRIMPAMIPDPMGWHPAPLEDVERILRWLEPLPELPDASNGATLATLCQTHPRPVFDFLCRRLDRAERTDSATHYEAIPRDYPRRPLPLAVLRSDPDFDVICQRLRDKATTHTGNDQWHEGWRLLYQSVVLPHPDVWKAPCLDRIAVVGKPDELDIELELLAGNGLGLAFGQPEITRAFLLKAEELGGTKGRDRMRRNLYSASSPEIRSWSGGALSPEHDYVQGAAFQAAKAHETDPVMGPFYRWVVGQEEKYKQWHHKQDAMDLSEYDEDGDS